MLPDQSLLPVLTEKVSLGLEVKGAARATFPGNRARSY
jgi:hypothetical protein